MASDTSEPIDAVIGSRIRRIREARDMTQRDLAERLSADGWELGATSVTKIEKGSRSLRVNELLAIAQVLGIRGETLLASTEDELASLYRELIGDVVEGRRSLLAALFKISRLMAAAREPGGRDLLQSAVPGLEGHLVDHLERELARATIDRLEVWAPTRLQAEEDVAALRRIVAWITDGMVALAADEPLTEEPGRGVRADAGLGDHVETVEVLPTEEPLTGPDPSVLREPSAAERKHGIGEVVAVIEIVPPPDVPARREPSSSELEASRGVDQEAT